MRGSQSGVGAKMSCSVKTCTALPPSVRERDAERIKHSAFAGVIGAYEYGRVVEIEVQRLDGSEIPDADLHGSFV